MSRKSFAILSLIAVVATARCTPRHQPVLAATLSSNDVAAGRKLYSQHCVSCHGTGAEGGRGGPSLHRDAVQTMSDGELTKFLAQGNVRRGMPSWSQLTAERRTQLARYIKSLENGER